VPVLCDDLAAVARTTLTSTREPTDPDDDITEAELLYGALSTVTKATGDSEGDPDDEDIVAMAGATTLTESRGDHESDPDEDDVRDGFVETGTTAGTQRPILYRFSEKGYSGTLNTRYDEKRQVSLLRSGQSVVSALLSGYSKK
jgi:hypothetical protein